MNSKRARRITMMESLPFLKWWMPFWCLPLLPIFTYQPFCSLTDNNSYSAQIYLFVNFFFESEYLTWMNPLIAVLECWCKLGGGWGVGGVGGGNGGVICLCARCCSLSCQIRVLHSQRCYMELHRKHSCNRLLLIYYSAACANSKDFLWHKILAISFWIAVKEKHSWGDESQMEE